MKKSIITLTMAGMLAVGGSVLAFADDAYRYYCNYKGNSAIESIMEEEGVTFEAAKEIMLNNKVQRIDDLVEKGVLNSEEGENIKVELKENIENCDVPGENRQEGNGYGLGLGNGNGNGNGLGHGYGRGMRNGSCRSN